MVILQIISDTHLEFESINKKNVHKFINQILVPPKTDKKQIKCLALLGDICCAGNICDFNKYKLFITSLMPLYDYIFIVPGNHEYYMQSKNIPKSKLSTIQGINEKINKFCNKYKKLYFLNNKSILLKLGKRKFYIFGATLWSYIHPSCYNEIKNMMNDYQYIYTYNKQNKNITKLTPRKVVSMHVSVLKKLDNLIKIAKKKKIPIIVLTHHKPYVNVKNKKNRYIDITSQAYESDLYNYIKYPVIIWGYGHTHIADNCKINNVNVISNPKGYNKQKYHNGFSKYCIIQF